MSKVRWLGRVSVRKHQEVVQITNAGGASDTIQFQLGEATITYTVQSGDDVDAVAAGLYALLTASDIPLEFAELEWSVSTDTLTGIATGAAAADGRPVPITINVTGTVTASKTTTTGTGPNDVSNADNWEGNSLPSTDDEIYLGIEGAAMLYGLTALAAVKPARWDVDSFFEGNRQIGLNSLNPAGYVEYRQLAIQLDGCDLVVFRDGDGGGCPFARFDLQSTNASAIHLEKTGTSSDGTPAFTMVGSVATNSIEVRDGASAGIALEGDETATVRNLYVSGGTLEAGPGATLNGASSTLVQRGGVVKVRTHAPLIVDVDAGTFVTEEAANVTTITVGVDGVWINNSEGTVTTTTMEGTVDNSGDLGQGTRTYTTFTLKPTGRVVGAKNATFTNGIVLDGQVEEVVAS